MAKDTKYYAVFRCRRCHAEFRIELTEKDFADSLSSPDRTTTHFCGNYTGMADIIGHDKETPSLDFAVGAKV